jgi:peptidoglycan/xylan/chitin deacetylase (PgdA/CDA1 family)
MISKDAAWRAGTAITPAVRRQSRGTGDALHIVGIRGDLMRIRGIGRLQRVAHRLMRRFAPTALILLYHRVGEVHSDPWALCVTPRHFAEHLEILRKHGRTTQLQQLPRALCERNLPHRPAVVVSFDDGYADNLHNAKPLLERYDIPATIFLTTGYIGYNREFWWDELDRLLLYPGSLPETLCLSINGSTHRWELGEAAHYREGTYQRHRDWRAWEDPPISRHLLYRTLNELLLPLPEEERREVLDELLLWTGAAPAARPTHRILSDAEAFTLAQGELVEVGAHTVTHSALYALSAASQRDEIQRSKTHLEELLGRLLTSFAYPYGKRSHYTEETVALVKEAGFARACSNFPGLVGRWTDRFQLPRMMVHDWDGDEFARQLRGWFSA